MRLPQRLLTVLLAVALLFSQRAAPAQDAPSVMTGERLLELIQQLLDADPDLLGKTVYGHLRHSDFLVVMLFLKPRRTRSHYQFAGPLFIHFNDLQDFIHRAFR